MKYCGSCSTVKEFSDFNKSKTMLDGLQYKCKSCVKEYNAQPRFRESRRAYQKDKSKAKVRRNANYRFLYNISLETYDEMREQQNHCCFLCGKHETDNKKFLAVDHDHETGSVRKLLCSSCNRGIGFLKDSPSLLDKAAEYLRQHGKS